MWIRRSFIGIGLFGLLGTLACAAPPANLTEFDQPLLFAYLGWEKKAETKDGKLVLRGDGEMAKGGGGSNVQLNLSEAADFSPLLKVKVGATNELKTLRLVLLDASEQSATFEFLLPERSDDFVIVTPKNGASLARPNALEKAGRPQKPPMQLDVSKIVQLQLQGDWSNIKAVDVEVDAVLLSAPTEAILKAREALAKQEQAERERVAREQVEQKAKYKADSPNAPQVTHVSLAAPDVIALTIETGKITPSKLEKYVAQPGDMTEKDGQVTHLKRNGQRIGWIIGPKQDTLVTYETYTGDPLLTFEADKAENYKIDGQAPVAVYRKSKPTNWSQPGQEFVWRHIVYLKMPQAVTPGKTRNIGLTNLNVKNANLTFNVAPASVRSDSIHVHQIGFRPDDPVKRAFLSIWMGTGGAYTFPESLTFQVVEDKSGKSVYSGKVEPVLAADATEAMHRKENFNKTAVYRMDFSAFNKPGQYRVVVEGVGCSFPFPVAKDVWDKAFRLQMRGLYNERSGVELKPPFADYIRPRDFHPADGVPVYDSLYTILDGPGESPELEKRSTGKLNPNGWGGYHDAGDWNPRRVTHMRVTMAQLEIMTLFPQYFRQMQLPIPKEKNVPDVLAEALFEIDCFRRIQKPDGGVPFGIETNGDPITGEVSWNQSMPAFVYGPDLWSSYVYAGVAARAAQLLQPTRPDLAKVYSDSALKAMAWAEADWAKRKTAGTLDKLPWEVKDDRNLTAVILYGLTRDPRWHDVFKENTVLKDANTRIFEWGKAVQRNSAFNYAILPEAMTDPTLRKNAVAAVEQQAQTALNYASGNAFNLTTADPGKPMFLGFFSTPDAIELVRAHYLTKKPEYLAGAVQATQFQAGCNPNNMTYTTGLGVNPPQNPLFLDTRRTGQPAPSGLTVFGNCDYNGWRDNGFFTWPVQWHLGPQCTPSAWDWPLNEAYFDIFLYPAITEFVVDNWSPNVYVWGYLAARK